MSSNEIARWLASLLPNATIWEIAAALVGIAAAGYAVWGAIDNLFDIRHVRREDVDGDPRGVAARFLLVANILFLLGWGGYTHVAMTAAYLPPRADLGPGALTDVAVMRLGYAVFNLLGLAVLREMRSRLRALPPENWDAAFGNNAKYYETRAELRRVEAEYATYRSRVHERNADAAREYARGVQDGRRWERDHPQTEGDR